MVKVARNEKELFATIKVGEFLFVHTPGTEPVIARVKSFGEHGNVLKLIAMSRYGGYFETNFDLCLFWPGPGCFTFSLSDAVREYRRSILEYHIRYFLTSEIESLVVDFVQRASLVRLYQIEEAERLRIEVMREAENRKRLQIAKAKYLMFATQSQYA
jgi:hypothetical protein